MTHPTIAELYKHITFLRAEIEGYKLTQKEIARGEAESHLAKIEEEIERRKKQGCSTQQSK